MLLLPVTNQPGAEFEGIQEDFFYFDKVQGVLWPFGFDNFHDEDFHSALTMLQPSLCLEK